MCCVLPPFSANVQTQRHPAAKLLGPLRILDQILFILLTSIVFQGCLARLSSLLNDNLVLIASAATGFLLLGDTFFNSSIALFFHIFVDFVPCCVTVSLQITEIFRTVGPRCRLLALLSISPTLQQGGRPRSSNELLRFCPPGKSFD